MSEVVRYTTQPLSLKPLEGDPGHFRRRRRKWKEGAPFTGTLVCELTARTPLCIQSLFAKLGDSDSPVVPGSSLRGMLRNVFEVLGASCLRLVEDAPATAPKGLRTCTREGTCVSCRLFGFTESQDFSWSGKVEISEAGPYEETDPRTGRKQIGPWSWVYVDAKRQNMGQPPRVNGWAVFPCVPFSRHTKQQAGHQLTRCVGVGSRLRFRVDYTNLDGEELSLLVFALTLRYQSYAMAHKIGYAKALGLGEVEIRVVNPARPVGPEIERYLNDPVFQEFFDARRI